MKINTSYPYPVLYMNNEDYKKSSYHTNISVNESFGELHIIAKFSLDNPGIKRLIEEAAAVFMIHVECGQTSFRQAYETSRETLEVAIPTNALRGKIAIHSFIIAKEAITDYTNDRLSDWYTGIQISFEKGNILGIGDAIETTLIDDNTELLNLPSIITVSKHQKNEFMDVEIQHDNITIYLPEYEYNQYAMSANSLLKNTILSTVIVPALVYVFSKIGTGTEDLEQYTWYQVMEKIFEENNLRLEDVGSDTLSPLKAAQLVLRKPLKSSFEEIEKLDRKEV
ncbi:hypothetical protein BC6307_07200 [Sutcliffiella cohnii]|uniref:Uncharacterized protein n=1 Tax=Sutcliffiella cohnii TaxID=33932 RepID=A0A223KNQ1_9BACI|nr:hypothetical protein [Sutcliffiella cohnii]AST91079.1 hypothetical protein BC6307_07200 [Sutcliffiella cohnii]